MDFVPVDDGLPQTEVLVIYCGGTIGMYSFYFYFPLLFQETYHAR